MMDTKSKVLLTAFLAFFVGTVAYSYLKYMVWHDFEVMEGEVLEDGAPLPEEPASADGEVDAI